VTRFGIPMSTNTRPRSVSDPRVRSFAKTSSANATRRSKLLAKLRIAAQPEAAHEKSRARVIVGQLSPVAPLGVGGDEHRLR